MGNEETLPSLTASPSPSSPSSSAVSSLAGRPSSDGVDIRGAVALPPAEMADKETLSASEPVRVADF